MNNNKSDSASKFRLLTFNPNSIGKNPKRTKILSYLKKKRANIILISDTRIAKEIEPLVKSEWGGKAHFASFTSQARGVAIFFTKEMPIEIFEDSIFKDPSGNFLVLNIKFENFIITLGCIYGPNNDSPNFYENVVFYETAKLQESSDFTIMGGDWNISLSQDMDTFGYTAENNKEAKDCVIQAMESLGLMDIFREFYPEKKRYSWRQFGGNRKARLNYFLTSAALLPYTETTDIIPGIASDHSIPLLEVDFSRFQRGRGFFKFNNSLCSDLEYVRVIIDAIREVTARYAENVEDFNFFKSASPEQLQEVKVP